MRTRILFTSLVLAGLALVGLMFSSFDSTAAGAKQKISLPGPPGILPGLPDAVIDLRTREGMALVQAKWRYSDVRIIDVDFRGPGPDLGPTGAPNRTQDIEPKAGTKSYDDSDWEVLDPATMEQRRSNGQASFNWYRINVTVPEKIGGFDPTGTTVLFELVLDDYAEIWVDGELPFVLGQRGGMVAAGFNAVNRVVLGRNVEPGQRFQIAVFGINGPISASPKNYIWLRSATLDFYSAARSRVAREVPAEILRQDPALDEVVPPEAKLELVAEGFEFLEGPVWARGGYLLFSSPNTNTIYRWAPEGRIDVYRTKSGYTGLDIRKYHQPGSNGLTFDKEGRLAVCEHGNRRVIRIEPRGNITVLADSYQGKRLNSPNDLVYRSDGSLYFTDPPFGLPKVFDDPTKELDFSGVYLVEKGEVRLVAKDLSGPNGLAFSPDEKFLYVGNWDPDRKIVMRYPVEPDGALGKGEVFYDMTDAPGEDALDGIKVDERGNLFVTGPGGLWILSAKGEFLGMIKAPKNLHNLAWGDADGRTLYMTAMGDLYRMRMKNRGVRPGPDSLKQP